MSRDQARKLIESNYPGSAIVELPVQLGTPEFKKSAVAGILVDITSEDDQAVNQSTNAKGAKDFEARKAAGFGDSPLNRTVAAAGDYGKESLAVCFNPNDGATDIIAVSRYKEFTKANFPVVKVLLQSLTEKYGPPSISKAPEVLTWMEPGALERTTKPFIVACAAGQTGGLLYEDAKSLSAATIGQSFVYRVNNIESADKTPYFNLSKCGTMLWVDLSFSLDRTYVVSMNVSLIDVSKAHSELKQFAADFWKGANDAKATKINKDMQNKPKL